MMLTEMKVDVTFRMTLNIDEAETAEEAIAEAKFEAQRIANEINRLDVPAISVNGLQVIKSLVYADN